VDYGSEKSMLIIEVGLGLRLRLGLVHLLLDSNDMRRDGDHGGKLIYVLPSTIHSCAVY